MGERIVYSTLVALRGAMPDTLRPLEAIARLWARSLRQRALFDGRVVLLSNIPGLEIDGVEVIATPFHAEDRRHLFVERVRRFAHVPVRPRDVVMQLDLDALAVAPLEPLFEAIRPGVLLAARSGSSPLIHGHAGALMSRRARQCCRLRGWGRRAGVSACVTACDGASWHALMRRWSAACRLGSRNRPVPELGDQAFLNWLFVAGIMPVRRLPAESIRHVRRPGENPDDPSIRRAIVLHFPFKERLAEMERFCQQ